MVLVHTVKLIGDDSIGRTLRTGASKPLIADMIRLRNATSGEYKPRLPCHDASSAWSPQAHGGWKKPGVGYRRVRASARGGNTNPL